MGQTAPLSMILSRLVDTFSSRIFYPMLLLLGNHSIAVVLSWEEDLPIKSSLFSLFFKELLVTYLR